MSPSSAVLSATRDDEQYQKQVAIKIVKRGMDTAHTAQFAWESAHTRAKSWSASGMNIAYLADAYVELASVGRSLDDWEGAANAIERADSLWLTIQDQGVLSVHRHGHERTEALIREIAAHREY